MPVSTIFEGININKTPYRDILLSLSSDNIVLLEEVKAKTMYMSAKRDPKFLKYITNEFPPNIKKSFAHKVVDEVKRKGYSIQEFIDLKQDINLEEENKIK